jgi:hypothetical protein
LPSFFTVLCHVDVALPPCLLAVFRVRIAVALGVEKAMVDELRNCHCKRRKEAEGFILSELP